MWVSGSVDKSILVSAVVGGSSASLPPITVATRVEINLLPLTDMLDYYIPSRSLLITYKS